MAWHAVNVKIISHALCMRKHAKHAIYFIIKTRIAEMSTGSMAAFHDNQGQPKPKHTKCMCMEEEPEEQCG